MGCRGGAKTFNYTRRTYVLDAGDAVERLGVDGWRRVVGCVGLFGDLWGRVVRSSVAKNGQ
jgi:hypothetical protein